MGSECPCGDEQNEASANIQDSKIILNKVVTREDADQVQPVPSSNYLHLPEQSTGAKNRQKVQSGNEKSIFLQTQGSKSQNIYPSIHLSLGQAAANDPSIVLAGGQEKQENSQWHQFFKLKYGVVMSHHGDSTPSRLKQDSIKESCEHHTPTEAKKMSRSTMGTQNQRKESFFPIKSVL